MTNKFNQMASDQDLPPSLIDQCLKLAVNNQIDLNSVRLTGNLLHVGHEPTGKLLTIAGMNSPCHKQVEIYNEGILVSYFEVDTQENQ